MNVGRIHKIVARCGAYLVVYDYAVRVIAETFCSVSAFFCLTKNHAN